MTRLETLKKKVAELYESKLESRDPWTDWMYPNHVLVVADNAAKLAEKYDANVELATVAALLHDFADYRMHRSQLNHEEESLKDARAIMTECGYSAEEIELVVEDAIRFHSCHNGQKPKSKEGLVLATADALAHFQTDFYLFALHTHLTNSSLEKIKDWALQKIDRDLYSKISFDDERNLRGRITKCSRHCFPARLTVLGGARLGSGSLLSMRRMRDEVRYKAQFLGGIHAVMRKIISNDLLSSITPQLCFAEAGDTFLGK